jgi:hypothetical protein
MYMNEYKQVRPGNKPSKLKYEVISCLPSYSNIPCPLYPKPLPYVVNEEGHIDTAPTSRNSGASASSNSNSASGAGKHGRRLTPYQMKLACLKKMKEEEEAKIKAEESLLLVGGRKLLSVNTENRSSFTTSFDYSTVNGAISGGGGGRVSGGGGGGGDRGGRRRRGGSKNVSRRKLGSSLLVGNSSKSSEVITAKVNVNPPPTTTAPPPRRLTAYQRRIACLKQQAAERLQGKSEEEVIQCDTKGVLERDMVKIQQQKELGSSDEEEGVGVGVSSYEQSDMSERIDLMRKKKALLNAAGGSTMAVDDVDCSIFNLENELPSIHVSSAKLLLQAKHNELWESPFSANMHTKKQQV